MKTFEKHLNEKLKNKKFKELFAGQVKLNEIFRIKIKHLLWIIEEKILDIFKRR